MRRYITAPNGPSQQAVMRAAMAMTSAIGAAAAARVLQMHGTGTPLGDPIEVGAARTVFLPPGAGAFDDAPLVLESCKAWDGHCEPAAGVRPILVAPKLAY